VEAYDCCAQIVIQAGSACCLHVRHMLEPTFMTRSHFCADFDHMRANYTQQQHLKRHRACALTDSARRLLSVHCCCTVLVSHLPCSGWREASAASL
jgi:hypothetical protein